MPSSRIREPAVAGAFYPSDPEVLRVTVDRLLAEAPSPPEGTPVPRAVVVPHAGYVYSGSTAALAYARVARGRDVIRRVVVIGPTHRVPVRGVALPGADGFRTPLGVMPVAEAWAEDRLTGVPAVCVFAETHRWEHSVEVQLPFLQRALGDVEIVPMLAGDATGEEVADVLDALWGGPETLVVISSDLSHYLPYDRTRHVDAGTIAQISALEGPLDHRQACGATPVNGLLVAARRHGLRPTLLGACNSGDTAGDRLRVVGYSAFAFDGDDVPDDAGDVLLPAARTAIARALDTTTVDAEVAADTVAPPAWALEPGACFVTLTTNGRLRGCIGSPTARRPLLEDVRANAVAAATRDPRFAPMTPHELPAVVIEVSVLSAPQPLRVSGLRECYAALRPGVDGVILDVGLWHRSLLLPQVWQDVPDPAQFLGHLWLKAGLAPGIWHEGTTLQTFTVRAWHEGPETAGKG